jgi:hypothetical protein
MIEQQEPKLRTESNTEEDNSSSSSEDTSDSSDIIIGDELTSGFRSNPIIVIRF